LRTWVGVGLVRQVAGNIAIAGTVATVARRIIAPGRYPPSPRPGENLPTLRLAAPSRLLGPFTPRTGACAVAERSLTILDGGNEFATEKALFKDAKKGDWAFVAACLVAAIFCGVWSVKLGVAHYKARHSATEFSSSHRPSK
jgi:hypothetical protein